MIASELLGYTSVPEPAAEPPASAGRAETVSDYPSPRTRTWESHNMRCDAGKSCEGCEQVDHHRQVAELQHQLAEKQRELDECRRSVVLRMATIKELEDVRRNFAERDREVERLTQALSRQEFESRRMSERGAADLEELRRYFFAKDQEAQELRAALQQSDCSCRLMQLEDELRRQEEDNARLVLELQQAVAVAVELQSQLEVLREEGALFNELHCARNIDCDDSRLSRLSGEGHKIESVSSKVTISKSFDTHQDESAARVRPCGEAADVIDDTSDKGEVPRDSKLRLKTPQAALCVNENNVANGSECWPLVEARAGVGRPISFAIDFFEDDDKDIAAKEVKRQQLVRQMEQRRQSRAVVAAAAAIGKGGSTQRASSSGRFVSASRSVTPPASTLASTPPASSRATEAPEAATSLSVVAVCAGGKSSKNTSRRECLPRPVPGELLESPKQTCRAVNPRRQPLSRTESTRIASPNNDLYEIATMQAGSEIRGASSLMPNLAGGTPSTTALCDGVSQGGDAESEMLPVNSGPRSRLGECGGSRADNSSRSHYVCALQSTRAGVVAACELVGVSPDVLGIGCNTPTLHARFEGLRDEMKRRRSVCIEVPRRKSDASDITDHPVAEAGAILEGSSPQAGGASFADTPATDVVGSVPLGEPTGPEGEPTFTYPTPEAPHRVSLDSQSSLRRSEGGALFPAPRLGLGASLMALTAKSGANSPFSPRSSRGSMQGVSSCSSSIPRASQLSPAMTPRHGGPLRLRSGVQDNLTSSSATVTDLCRRRLSQPSRSASTGHVTPQPSRQSRPGDIPGEMEYDTVHEAVSMFCMSRPPSRYHLYRLQRGVYLYGNKKLVVALINDKLMVRIGGGMVNLDTFLLDSERLSSASAAPQGVGTGTVGGQVTILSQRAPRTA